MKSTILIMALGLSLNAHAGFVECLNGEGDFVRVEGLINHEGIIEAHPDKTTAITLDSSKQAAKHYNQLSQIDPSFFGGSRQIQFCGVDGGGIKVRLILDPRTGKVDVRAASSGTWNSISFKNCNYVVEDGDAEAIEAFKSSFPTPEANAETAR